MLDFLCDKYPYILVGFFFFRAIKESKHERERKRFFINLLSCCVLSVLLKYVFSGERPSTGIPGNWKKTEDLLYSSEQNSKFKGNITITPKIHYEYLEMQPIKEIFVIPGLSEIKHKIFPRSGTPSSHSFLSGFLIYNNLSKKRRNLISFLLLVFLSYSRILFSYHFSYQVFLGVFLGILYGFLKSKIIFYYV
ncbi:hypothetical protein NEFER03_1869 [Nematocida sp. LUAm3]|nr:hypothetical protein NEFER03_1869 [Nematocida sp. LUAm3]